MLTLQQCFDNAWNHFVVNKAPPAMHRRESDGAPTCVYRHPKDPNIRCAIGVSIPDEIYRSWMENQSIWRLMQNNSHRPPFNPDDINALEDLQERHDTAAVDGGANFHEAIESNLRNFAEFHKLEIPQ